VTTEWTGVRVLVTGASLGIGRGIAEGFARAGAHVAIAGRDEARLATVRDGVEGGTIHPVVGDVSSRAGVRAIVEEAIAALGGLDVLCANVGVYPELRIDDLTEEHLRHVMSTNLDGTVFAVQAAAPALRASERGRIVITSSITGPTVGYPGLSAYAASKAAQLGFMRSAALEFAPDGVTVNAVLPGSIVTEGLAGLGEDAMASMRRNIPIGRVGVVGDIAAAVRFLASEEASFVTGQALVVDGGQTLPELPDLV